MQWSARYNEETTGHTASNSRETANDHNVPKAQTIKADYVFNGINSRS